METIKHAEGTYYILSSTDGVSFSIGRNFCTIKEAESYAEKSHETQKKAGYAPERFLVVKVRWERNWHEDGTFINETVFKRALFER